MQSLFLEVPLASVAAPNSLTLQSKVSDGEVKHAYWKCSLQTSTD